jgi:Ca2+-binding RTX toxin-like protein
MLTRRAEALRRLGGPVCPVCEVVGAENIEVRFLTNDGSEWLASRGKRALERESLAPMCQQCFLVMENTGDGENHFYGGNGADTVNGGNNEDTLNGGAGNDTLYGGSGTDTLHGNDGNDSIYGGASSDTLYGDSGNDTLDGGDSSDTIYGGEGNDTITGGTGNDTIYGGAGSDTMTGGTGNDTFVYNKADLTENAVDTITDFGTKNDKLDIANLLDGYNNKLSDFARLVDSTVNGQSVLHVQVDTDGTKSGAAWKDIALLNGVSSSGVKLADIIVASH